MNISSIGTAIATRSTKPSGGSSSSEGSGLAFWDIAGPALAGLGVMALGWGMLYYMLKPTKQQIEHASSPQRMEVISTSRTEGGSVMILRDRETGEEYMSVYGGGVTHLVKPSTTPKP